MKKLLLLAAFAEVTAGLALMPFPGIGMRLLFNAGGEAGMGRIAGILLIAVGLVCWPERNVTRAFWGMLTFSVGAAIFLVCAGWIGRSGLSFGRWWASTLPWLFSSLECGGRKAAPEPLV
jgi:hypothetical protein